jgi:uncharacterized membrane protein
MKSSGMIFSLIFGLCICSTLVGAYSIEYYIVVEPNGNSVVIMTVHGSGLVNIPIDGRTDNINVKGALYRVNDDSIDVSIGSTEEAVVVYTTPMLTQKTDNWEFRMDLVGSESTTATVALSPNVTITGTEPAAFIDVHDFKEVKWEENVSEIAVQYYFENIYNPLVPGKGSMLWVVVPIAVVGAGAGGFMYFRKGRQRARLRNRENLLRTLSDNERKVVEALIASGGQMRRSKVERKTGISKSSLAGALKNLERKKIVELDKTYKTHSIKLTEWFDEI